MKGRVVWAASVMVLIGVSSFAGCGDKKKEATAEDAAPAPPPPATSSAPAEVKSAEPPPPAPVDAGPEDAAAELPAVIVDASAPPPVEAANVVDIARYPDEKKSDEVVNVKWKLGDVHKAASETDILATLQAGAAVKKIASHGAYYLVVFEDPTTTGRTLMGWMIQKTIDTEEPDAGAPPVVTCRTGLTPFAGQSNRIHCETRCTPDGVACPADLACEGEGIVTRNGRSIIRANYCIKSKATPPVVIKDAGAPVAPDAGAPVAPDAGAPVAPDAGAPVAPDAGAKRAMTIKMHIPRQGCPGGYVTIGTEWCRLSCTKNEDCAASPNAQCRANKACYSLGDQ